MNYWLLFRVTLPETLLEIAALLVLVVDLGLLRKAVLKARLAVAVSLGVVGCGAAIFAVRFSGNQWLSYGKNDEGALLAAGGFVSVAQVGILVLTALTLLLLFNAKFTRHVGEYVAVVLMAAAGGLLIAAAQDLLVIFIGLELLSLGLYILTAFAKSSGNSAEAAMKYYLFGGMSAAFLLFGFSYFYGLTGTTSLQLIQYRITLLGASPLLYVAWILVVAGLGFKVAVVPFHLWAPDAYEGAPAPAAAFIASVSKVASFALLITLAMNWWLRPGGDMVTAGYSLEQILRAYYKAWPPLGNVLLVAAAASMVLGNLAALAQTSVRRLLAYSAIAHGGYILLGLAAHPILTGQGTAMALNAGSFFPALRAMASVLFYVLTYALTTVGAFGAVSVVENAAGNDRLDAFLGLRKRNPLLAAVLLVLFLSLAGIPPLVGFWAKFNLFAAVLGEHAGRVPFALVCLAIAMSAVSLYYYLQVLKRAYVMPGRDESPIKVHPVTMVVLVGIAAIVVLLGVFPALLGAWIQGF
ncbi:MAG: NADH-quinone oxidoreductase subunit N [Terracidiphilus sp.]|jgi:NADH-quinone oxidoreductase subunit N